MFNVFSPFFVFKLIFFNCGGKLVANVNFERLLSLKTLAFCHLFSIF